MSDSSQHVVGTPFLTKLTATLECWPRAATTKTCWFGIYSYVESATLFNLIARCVSWNTNWIALQNEALKLHFSLWWNWQMALSWRQRPIVSSQTSFSVPYHTRLCKSQWWHPMATRTRRVLSRNGSSLATRLPSPICRCPLCNSYPTALWKVLSKVT